VLKMNPLTLLDLFHEPAFRAAFVIGVAALVLVLVVRQAGWLLVWGVAGVVALAWTGWLYGNSASPEWGLAAVIVAAVASAVAYGVLLREVPAWSVGLVFAFWVLGVWGTVPDTERALVLMGSTAPMLLALWPRLRVRVGWEGALVAVGCLGFVAVADGAARETSIVGALGMAGMAVVAAAFARRPPGGRRLSPWWLVVAQMIHVIVSGRIAGQSAEVQMAVVIVAVSALVTGAVVAFGFSLRSDRE
jgi:hypothetical protein